MVEKLPEDESNRRSSFINSIDYGEYDFISYIYKELINVDPRLKDDFMKFILQSARTKRNEITLAIEPLDLTKPPKPSYQLSHAESLLRLEEGIRSKIKGFLKE